MSSRPTGFQHASRAHAVALAVVACALVGTSANAPAALLVYSQAVNPVGAQISENDAAVQGHFATTYDNFTLAQETSITHIDWDGSYIIFPFHGTINSFQVQIWSDVAGAPGVPVNNTVVAGNAGETFLELNTFGEPVYKYGLDLASSFDAAAGTAYWISVVPTTPSVNPQWGWEFGTGGDGLSYLDLYGQRNATTADFAFNLYGNTLAPTVPEPATLPYIGLGLAAAALAFGARGRLSG